MSNSSLLWPSPENATGERSKRDVCDDASLEEITGLLQDDYARTILKYSSDSPRSARELLEYCDASKATVYRRIDRLREEDLLETFREYDPDGHHYETFAANLKEITVRLDDGTFEMTITR